MRYIDDAVVRQVSAAFTDSPAAGEFPAVLSVSWDDAIDEEEGRTAKRWWYLTDVQFSVVGLIDPTWGSMVVERVEYSPYGVPLYQPATDFDGDGDVDVGDEFAFLDAWYAQFGGSGIGPGPASADRDRSGAVDVGDLFDFLDAWFADFPVGGPGAPEGWISRKDVPPSMGVQDGPLGPDNPVGYCGYIHNPETGDYTVRFRHYSPRLGRWLERDPAGYLGGMNLLEYARGRSPKSSDPYGLIDPATLEDDSKLRAEWMQKQDARYSRLLLITAQKYCIPYELLRAMVLNEMADYSSLESFAEKNLGIGNSLGPAQISIVTALKRNLLPAWIMEQLNNIIYYDKKTGIGHVDQTAAETLQRVIRAYLNSDAGSIDAAGKLLQQYLVDLCDKMKSGKVSNAFVSYANDNLVKGLTSNEVCCVSATSPESASCSGILESDPSPELLRAIAAMWNNGPKITSSTNVLANSRNAYLHGHHAANLFAKYDNDETPPDKKVKRCACDNATAR